MCSAESKMDTLETGTKAYMNLVSGREGCFLSACVVRQLSLVIDWRPNSSILLLILATVP